MDVNSRTTLSVMNGLAALVATFGAVSFSCAQAAESHRLVLRTAPEVTLHVDADNGPWFLPHLQKIDHSAFGDSQRIRSVFSGEDLISLHALFPDEARVNPIARAHRLDRYYLAEFADQDSLLQAFGELQILVGQDDILESVEVDGWGGVASIPNDPNFNLQYGLRNTGQSISGQSGQPGADISITDAWSQTTGSPNVTVAVLDSGVNAHEEFIDRMVPGWNVPDQNSNVTDQCSSHGTHVSGIIGAAGDNGVGVAGIAWGVKIMPVVVLSGCSGFESDCALGIQWATDNGADVINYSLQYSTGTQVFQDAAAYAQAQGVIQVAASGNTTTPDDVQAPARFSEVMSVASVDNTDTRVFNSSQGPEVDFAAAGWQVYSTIGTSQYGFQNGTSMASPHVAGIVCLLRSLVPDISQEEVFNVLVDTAEDISSPGFDVLTGYGRPNAWAAIQALDVEPPAPGDLNLDGVVDGIDFGILLVAWGSCGDCEEEPCPADIDGNCQVNGIDVGLLLVDWTG